MTDIMTDIIYTETAIGCKAFLPTLNRRRTQRAISFDSSWCEPPSIGVENTSWANPGLPMHMTWENLPYDVGSLFGRERREPRGKPLY